MPGDAVVPWSEEDFRAIAAIVRSHRGPPLPPHRLSLLRARLRVRLTSRDIPSFTWFHDHFLRGRPDGPDMQLLVDLSTVNHTSFFREPGPLEALADGLAGRLRVEGLGPLRVWSAGCSAGQEPYSLAILLSERLPLLSPAHLELVASDLSLDILQDAARAIYDVRSLSEMSGDRLRRFFLRGRGARRGFCRVSPEIRRLVTFRQFDLHASEWPIAAGLDAILCRNVLIYCSPEERVTILGRMAPLLRDGGWLVVGSSEILTEHPRSLVKHAPSIFRKVASP